MHFFYMLESVLESIFGILVGLLKHLKITLLPLQHSRELNTRKQFMINYIVHVSHHCPLDYRFPWVQVTFLPFVTFCLET